MQVFVHIICFFYGVTKVCLVTSFDFVKSDVDLLCNFASWPHKFNECSGVTTCMLVTSSEFCLHVSADS